MKNTQPMQQQPAVVHTREDFIKQLFPLDLPKDNFLLGREAQEKFVKGVEKALEILKGSYGPAGSNVTIRRDMRPGYESTNDGKKILEGIKLADPYEQIGFNTVKEVAEICDREGRDGRKTGAILYAASIIEGYKSKENPMDLKRSLEECIPLVIESIIAQSKGISVDEVDKIATIASESPKLGALFKEIYQKIGSDGTIELENSGLSENTYDITDGVKLLNCKFMYPYMCTNREEKIAEYFNPKILISKQKVINMGQINNIIKGLVQKGIYNMVLFCDDIELIVNQVLAQLSEEGKPAHEFGLPGNEIIQFRTLVIKAPILWKDWIFEDFAKISGATIIDPGSGVPLKSVKLEHLGTCDKITTDKEKTVIRHSNDIESYVESILNDGNDDSKIRASRLKSKTAILKLGADSESQLSHLRGKALDARNSSFQAMESGIVSGGGVALLKSIESLPDTIGGKILKKVFSYPHMIIAANMGLLKTPRVPFVFGDDVIDSTAVLINSTKTAISVAATQLTVKGVIV
jgi:chaperonin GroEL